MIIRKLVVRLMVHSHLIHIKSFDFVLVESKQEPFVIFQRYFRQHFLNCTLQIVTVFCSGNELIFTLLYSFECRQPVKYIIMKNTYKNSAYGGDLRLFFDNHCDRLIFLIRSRIEKHWCFFLVRRLTLF